MVYRIKIVEISNSGVATYTDITNYVQAGFSFVEKLNEELDIGSMELKFVDRKVPYGMFDTVRVEIYNNSTSSYDLFYSMRIGGDNVSLASKKPLLYNHILSLVEHTKILERVVISGKTFTQPTDGSTALSLFDVIDTLRQIYPLETNDNLSTTRLFTIPSSLETYLDAIESPEFTFKDITLREALNQVVSYVDGIVRLVEPTNLGDPYQLQIDFFNDLVDLISDETDILDKKVVQDISLYGTDMTVDALNLVNDNDESEAIEIYPAKNAYTTSRSKDYIYDFDTSYIPTPKPIYKINKIKIYVDVVLAGRVSGSYYNVLINGVNQTGYIEVDMLGYDNGTIEPRVLEYDRYKQLEADEPANTTSGYYYQSNTIYYNYGERNIQSNNTVKIWGTDPAIENALIILIQDYLEENNAYLDDSVNTAYSTLALGDRTITINTDVKDYMYKVYYTPIPKSTRFNVDRQDLTDVYKKSTLMTNQQSRIVNTDKFISNSQAKINKIGNSELKLFNRVNNKDDIYNISDYTDENYILTSKEVICFKDNFDCNYDLSRDWNKLSQFVGVNSEIRQWEIGEKDRTLQRDLLYKEYVEINAVTSGSGSNTSQLIQTDGVKTYLNTFSLSATTDILPVSLGMFVSSSIPSTVLAPVSSNGGGNSLLFRFQFNHNRDAGSFKDEKATVPVQVATQYASYTTDDGKLTSFTPYYFDEMTSATSYANYLIDADLYPKTSYTKGSTTLLQSNSVINIYKDNREILSFMYQIQNISSDTGKVILGKSLSRRNALVNESKPTNIKLHIYNTETFGKKDNKKAIDGADYVYSLSASEFTLTVNTTDMNLTIAHTNLTLDKASYCLTDENDNLLLAVNQGGSLLDTITFDFKNKRSGINYKY